MTFPDFQTNHVTSHVTHSDTWHLTPTLPLSNTDTITRLGRLPNRDVRMTSNLGNTPFENPRTQTTERHSGLTVTHTVPMSNAHHPHVTVICMSLSATWCPRAMPITHTSPSFVCRRWLHSTYKWCPSPTHRHCLHVAISHTVPMLRSKVLKVRRAQVVLRRKWSQGTGTLSDVGSALRSLPKTNVLW